MASQITADSLFHFIRLLRNHIQELWLGQSSLASYHNMGYNMVGIYTVFMEHWCRAKTIRLLFA